MFQPLSYKIIKKIGNINSVKLGTVLLFLGSFMITFSKQYYLIVIGESLYELAFLFKNMDSVMLKKNLKYMKQEKEFERERKKKPVSLFLCVIQESFVS